MGLGSTYAGGDYYFIDYTAENGVRYYYMLEDVEDTGKTAMHGTTSAVPDESCGPVPNLDEDDFVSSGTTSDEGGEVAAIDPPVGPPDGVDPPGSFVKPLSSSAWIVEQSDDGMLIVITPPDYEKTPVTENGSDYTRIDMPGYRHTTVSGKPAMPTGGLLIPAGDCGRVRMTVVSKKVRRIEQVENIYRTPGGFPPLSGPLGRSADVPVHLYDRAGAQAAAAERGTWPARTVTSSGLVRHGTENLVLLTVNPARYMESGEILKSYSRIVVRLAFEGAPAVPEPPAAGDLADFVSGRDRLKIRIKDPGVYRLVLSDVVTFFGESLDPRNLTLTRMGVEVPIFVSGETDGVFDTGDYVEFFAAGFENEYTDENVYFLVLSDVPGMRVDEADASPGGGPPAEAYLETRRFEQDLVFDPPVENLYNSDGWIWMYVAGLDGMPMSWDFDFDITDASASAASDALLDLALQGDTDWPEVETDHHAAIYINGQYIDDITFKGKDVVRLTLPVPQSALSSGTNTLTFRVYCDTGAEYDIFYVDWFKVSYWRDFIAEGALFEFNTTAATDVHASGLSGSEISVYNVTDPYAPIRMTGVEFSCGSLTMGAPCAGAFAACTMPPAPAYSTRHAAGLKDTALQADYLLLTHADFKTAAGELAAWREAGNLSVMVADAEDIYDEFSFGFESPHALRAFFAYASENYEPPAPTFALILGDASIDPKGRQGGKTNFVPTKFVWTDIAIVPSDNWLAAFSGGDVLPDVILGRIPVSTAASAEAVVAKIKAYEQAGTGDWCNRALLVSDVEADFDFEAAGTDVIRGALPAYMNETHIVVGPTARTDLISSWNTGAGIVHFAGHGAANYWGSTVQVFTSSDAAGLANGEALPLVLVSNCVSADFTFHQPDHECVGEALVENADGGAVAVFASSGFTRTLEQVDMHAFMLELFYSGEKRVGVLADEARRHMFAGGSRYAPLVETWVLLGDPAVMLK